MWCRSNLPFLCRSITNIGTRRYLSLSSSLFQSVLGEGVTVSDNGRVLQLKIQGEEERRYHGVWLRHNCRCPICLSKFSNQNIVHHSNLINLKITDAKIDTNQKTVQVNWDSAGGHHECTFDIKWLKDYDYSTPSSLERKHQEEIPLVTDTLPSVDCTEASSSDEGLYKFLRQINFYGASLVTGIPADKDFFDIFSHVAPIQEHVYAKVFDVIAKEDPIDAAYGNDDLIYHMDQGFYESPPGIQVLHCLKFDECVTNGQTILVDAYPIAETIRKEHPQQFKALTEIPYSIQRIHGYLETENPVAFLQRKPHITLDHNGRIIAFNWSPQFHGPLQAPEGKVEEYYEAFILMSKMLEESPNKIVHRLRPGEALCFNNRRMVHSRNAFQLNGGQRQLRGFYYNIDFFRSKFQMLAYKLETGENSKCVFNSRWSYQ